MSDTSARKKSKPSTLKGLRPITLAPANLLTMLQTICNQLLDAGYPCHAFNVPYKGRLTASLAIEGAVWDEDHNLKIANTANTVAPEFVSKLPIFDTEIANTEPPSTPEPVGILPHPANTANTAKTPPTSPQEGPGGLDSASVNQSIVDSIVDPYGTSERRADGNPRA